MSLHIQELAFLELSVEKGDVISLHSIPHFSSYPMHINPEAFKMSETYATNQAKN
jgi:hypothetical protein